MPEQDEPQQLVLMRQLVDLSAQRSEMAAERSYMNAERTLSVWIRTALAVMVLGIGIDRFKLMLLHQAAQGAGLDRASGWVGAALVAFGILIALVTGIRFRLYVATYRRAHSQPWYHSPVVALGFALITALFGLVLLILLLAGP